MLVSKKSRNVLRVEFDDIRDGWEKWFLLSSDRHHDSGHTDRKLAKEHLQECQDKDAHVLDFGDFFDAMQGKYDPRRSYPDMMPQYLDSMQQDGIGYLDAITKDAVDFYKPFADRFVLIGRGNHETAIFSHNDTDLTNRIVYGLNSEAGTNIHVGGYGGWAQFKFTIQGTKRQSVNLKYHHGYGGGGPVTKGVIQANRQAVYLPDAHIVVNGHIHESWILPMKRERFNSHGTISQDYQYHIRTGTYKDEYGDGYGGWANEKGMPPKPKGAVWLRFFYRNGGIDYQFTQALA